MFSGLHPASDEQRTATDNDWDLLLSTASKKQRKLLARFGPKRPQLEELRDVILPDLQADSFPKFHDKTANDDIGLQYDYSEVLSHVQLYAFAKQYMIENLQ